MTETMTLSGEEIVEAASAWRPFLISRLGHSDAEDVFSELCELLWMARDQFDSERGSARSWAGGFARNLVRRRSRVGLRGIEDADGADAGLDPAAFGFRQERMLLRVVASSVSPLVWALTSARAYAPASTAELARAAGVSPRRVTAAFEELAWVADTARRALEAALSGVSPDEEVLRGCVTPREGLAAVAAHLAAESPDKAAAAALGISVGTARKRLSYARRMVLVAERAFEVAAGREDA